MMPAMQVLRGFSEAARVFANRGELPDAGARDVVDRHVRAGLLERGERLRLTDKGRLLADGIITDILAAE